MKTLQVQPGIKISVEPQLETIKGTEFSEDIEIEDREHQLVETKEHCERAENFAYFNIKK